MTSLCVEFHGLATDANTKDMYHCYILLCMGGFLHIYTALGDMLDSSEAYMLFNKKYARTQLVPKYTFLI